MIDFFLSDQQQAATLTVKRDWSQHPLGTPDTWPLALKITLGILFNTRTPMFLYWGPEYYCFYNDGYIPIIGESHHPWAIGEKGEAVWAEAWESFAMPQIRVALEGRSTWNVDQYIPLRRNGVVVDGYFTYSYSPVFLENGEIGGLIVVTNETTEKVNSTQKILQSEARFKQISEVLPQLIWTCLPDGRCDFLSSQWEAYTGIKQEAQLGYRWPDLVIHPEDRVRTFEQWHNAVKGNAVYDVEYRIRRNDGAYRWFKTRGTPIRNTEGQIQHWFGTCTDIDETKQAQLQYERNIDASPAILWITDSLGNCTYLSKQWFEYTGQKPEEGQGLGWLDAVHPVDRIHTEKQFLECNSKQIPFNFEYRLLHKNGEYRWAIDSGNPRFDNSGNYIGYAGTVIDIHDRVNTELKFQQEYHKFEALFTESPAAMALLQGPEFIFEKINLNYQTLIGGRDLLGKPLIEALPELQDQPFYGIMKKVFETGESYSGSEIIARIIRKPGGVPEDTYLDFSYIRVDDGEGNPYGIYIHAIDITDKVQARIKLEESEGLIRTNEARFRQIARSIPALVWTASTDGSFTYYNHRWYEYTGLNWESAQGMGWHSTVHPDDLPRVIHKWKQSVATGHTFNEEFRVLCAQDGLHHWHLARAEPITGELGDIVQWFGTLTDINEQKMTSEHLGDALRARDEFLSIASHELKTPLTSLKLQAQLHSRLIHKKDQLAYSEEKVNSMIVQTERQISRLTRLVDDMLDVSRIRTGKLRIERESFKFGDLVAEVIERLDSHFSTSSYSVPSFQITGETEGHWDRMRLEQVITNLLTNAIRYGNNNPISVTVFADTHHIWLTVEDKGIGIAENARDKIFNRFERAINANEVSGLGLGLFITKQIVLAHMGQIWVESELGKGSKFIIELPKVQKEFNGKKTEENLHVL